jgi:DNA-binding HxlR family transcriptional regulator
MNRRDYCPIAASVEVLGDRWTPLIIREVMVGARRLQRDPLWDPRVSRTLLAQRLRELERRGLMRHEASRRGRPGVYALTAAGQALTPIAWAGACAAEWMFGDPRDEDCDGLTLIWRTHQVAIPARLPETRTVVHLVLTGAGGAQGWLDIQRPGITVCKDDQGLAVDLALEG